MEIKIEANLNIMLMTSSLIKIHEYINEEWQFKVASGNIFIASLTIAEYNEIVIICFCMRFENFTSILYDDKNIRKRCEQIFYVKN